MTLSKEDIDFLKYLASNQYKRLQWLQDKVEYDEWLSNVFCYMLEVEEYDKTKCPTKKMYIGLQMKWHTRNYKVYLRRYKNTFTTPVDPEIIEVNAVPTSIDPYLNVLCEQALNDPTLPIEQEDIEALFTNTETRVMILQHLANDSRLTQTEKETLLGLIEEKPLHALAEELSITPSAISSRKKTLKKVLRKYYPNLILN